MMIQSAMFEVDQLQGQRHLNSEAARPQDFLAAENVSLRLLLAQAEIDAQELARPKPALTPGSVRQPTSFRS